MNTNPAECISENPWNNRDQLPKVSKLHIILAVVACLVSAVGLPLCGHAWFVAPIVALALCGYVAYAARSPFAILVILVTAFSMMMLGIGFAGVAVVLSLIVGGATLAYLLTVIKPFYFVPLIPLAGCLIVFCVSGDWQLSLLAWFCLPAGILLALATVLAKDRTTAICFAAGGLLISLLALGAAWIYLKTGGVARGQILAVIDGVKDAILQQIAPIRDELFAIAEQTKNPSAMQVAESFAAMYTEETILQLMQLIPAVAVVACSVLAFEMQLLLGMTYFSAGLSDYVPKQARIFTMSLTAAVLYCASFLLLLLMPAGSLAAAVTQNASLILMPGFAVLGIQGLLVSFARTRGGARAFVILFTVAMLCCASEMIFYILALWGAYGRITEAIQRKILGKMKENGNRPDDEE